jgi:hypothetical protein
MHQCLRFLFFQSTWWRFQEGKLSYQLSWRIGVEAFAAVKVTSLVMIIVTEWDPMRTAGKHACLEHTEDPKKLCTFNTGYLWIFSKLNRTVTYSMQCDILSKDDASYMNVRATLLNGRTVENATDCSRLLTLVPCSRIFLPWTWRRNVPPKRRFAQDRFGILYSHRREKSQILHTLVDWWV